MRSLSFHKSHLTDSEQEETHDIVTGVQEDYPHCSPGTSRKQKMARSTSQPQFRSGNTPATTEADQILLALQKLVTNSNSAKFNINTKKNLEIVQITHNNNAHLGWQIRKNRTV